jgi:hypothetical protein
MAEIVDADPFETGPFARLVPVPAAEVLDTQRPAFRRGEHQAVRAGLREALVIQVSLEHRDDVGRYGD